MSEEPQSPAAQFGHEIKRARESRGWSQTELAD
ncbi:helix-turn-helix transcriptional regulator [Streptantibioticus ferralitis]|uniref:Helix-turn-helix transcriptional regulator n=1 Tax=Streptantibioticus ferralitis TaxID=236510 RepID=A0ABT5Z1A8_9ACTN|nr:helix-turn-helix transcriptional regulator [Streptantibioticus ferralitis]MDF2257622.1 helix-turn-helix transcriptional regulator [Streptantibioticus ferralitis]